VISAKRFFDSVMLYKTKKAEVSRITTVTQGYSSYMFPKNV